MLCLYSHFIRNSWPIIILTTTHWVYLCLSITIIHPYFQLFCQSKFLIISLPNHREGEPGTKRVDTKGRGRKTNNKKEESGSKQLNLVQSVNHSTNGQRHQNHHHIPLSWRRSPIIWKKVHWFVCKSMDQFLYDRDSHHDRVNVLLHVVSLTLVWYQSFPNFRILCQWYQGIIPGQQIIADDRELKGISV